MMSVMRHAVVVLLVVLALGTQAAQAIEEMGAEEDISDYLPDVYPVERTEEDLQARRWAVLPEFGYAPDTGPLIGLKYAQRDLFQTQTTLDVDGSFALNQQRGLSVSLGSPHLLDNRVIVLFRGRYYLDPQRQFFGLGNNEFHGQPGLPSTHEIQELGFGMTVGWRPFERLAFNFSFGTRRVDIGHGIRKGNDPFTQEEFPDLIGINGGLSSRLALSLVWNNRDDVIRPTRGFRVIFKIERVQKGLLSDFDFTRFVLDVGYLRSFFDKRVIAGLRANGGYIDGPSDEVPFWELEELGGQDSMRGFFPHRFLGKERILLNGEIRCLLTEFDFYHWWHVRLDGVVFGDGGRVFASQSELNDELNSNVIQNIVSDFRYSYGGGLRIALSDALVARIDVGFSDEETGLVYLSFGQTF